MSKKEAAAYLAAMIDGEGWIGNPSNSMNRAVRIANTDPELISAITEACDILGITYTVQTIPARRTTWKPGWCVDIRRVENLIAIRDGVPLRSSRKLERLHGCIDAFAHQPLDVGRLRSLYESGLTVKEVAAEMQVGKKRVILAMSREGIPGRNHAERSSSVWRARYARYGAPGRPS